MSTWYTSKKEDLKLDGEEIIIWVTKDDTGNIYTTVKIKDVEDILLSYWGLVSEEIKEFLKTNNLK